MNELKEIMDKWKVLVFRGFAPTDPVKITKDIPYNEIIPFGAINGDIITRVDTRGFKGGEEAYVLLYQAPKGTFMKHFHPNLESGIILKGKLIYKNPFKDTALEAGDTWKIEKDLWHTFEFLEDSLLVIFFHPTVDEGWEAALV